MLGRSRPESFARQALASFAALMLLAFVLAALAPVAGAETDGEGPLSTELEALATPAVAALPLAAQAEAVGLPAEGPGSLSREGGRVVVEARVGVDRLEALRTAGAKVLGARDGTVALSVEPGDLESLAAVPGIAAVAPALRPVVYDATGEPVTAATVGPETCEGGSVISQGVAQLNVPAARTAFGARGAGLTIGVISDSFDSATKGIEGASLATRASNDEASNDLPGGANTCTGQGTPVDVVAEAPRSSTSEDTDEGRAMLQVVHDVAPHAKLAFATALSSEVEFARNIERLAEPISAGGGGAQVIVDDIGYLSEPFFQDGPVAVAIKKVTESGVTYLTAAGNENLRDALRRNIGSWEAPAYRPMACPRYVNTFLGETSNGCMSFSPVGKDAEFGIEVAAGGSVQIDLQWAEPWNGVKTDLDAYLFNENLEVVSNYKEGGGTLNSIELQKPIEVLNWENKASKAERVFLVINRCSGTCNPLAGTGTPGLKFEFVGHGDGVTGIEYPVSAGGDVVGPTIYGHAGSAAAVSVGAVRYSESSTAPREPEYYSSRGPVTHYFGPVVGTTPASTLSSPEVLAKPDLTATDCASTTFFARLSEGAYRFCGTSEAAPHAAAVAALMKQTAPSASPAQILAAMKSSATAYSPASTANSAEAVGAGLLNAAGALNALGGSPVVDPPSTDLVVTGGESSVAKLDPQPVIEANPAALIVNLTSGPSSATKESRPTFGFQASRSVTFSCRVDGGSAVPCSSPYKLPSALADGAHSFLVTGTDAAGRSASSTPDSFTVDTKAPTTSFAEKPKKLLRTKKGSVLARFALKASEAPVTFYCQIDKSPLRRCPASFAHRFRGGAHVVRVKARDSVGNLATNWTAYRFRVRQVRPAPRRTPR